jgi:hypothetical protein
MDKTPKKPATTHALQDGDRIRNAFLSGAGLFASHAATNDALNVGCGKRQHQLADDPKEFIEPLLHQLSPSYGLFRVQCHDKMNDVSILKKIHDKAIPVLQRTYIVLNDNNN